MDFSRHLVFPGHSFLQNHHVNTISTIRNNIVKFQLSEHEKNMSPFTVGESTLSKGIISVPNKKEKNPVFFFTRLLPRCIRPFAFVRKLKAEGFRPGVALQGVVTEWNDLPKHRGFGSSIRTLQNSWHQKEVSNFCERQKSKWYQDFLFLLMSIPSATSIHSVANLKSWSCCWTRGTRLFAVLDRAPLMKFGCWKWLVFFCSPVKNALRIEMVYSPKRTRYWRRLEVQGFMKILNCFEHGGWLSSNGTNFYHM